jgi:hypothetical protein
LSIPDLGSKNSKNKREVKKFFVLPFFVATKITKFKIILIWANLQRIIELSSQEALKNMGFGIRDPEKTYSGSRIQGSKRYRIPDPDTQHWEVHDSFVKVMLFAQRSLEQE